MRIEYEKCRPNFTWLIRETEQCIFHIDSSYEANNDITEIISDTQKRHLSIAEILSFDLDSIQKKEKRQKYNYWFYSPQIITDSGITLNDSFKSTGQASTSGVDYVVYNQKWIDAVEHIFHEEVHLLVMCEIGEAPSIFNEGIAVYTESVFFKGKDEFYKQCSNIWKTNIVTEKGLVRKLMSNEFFWSNLKEVPVYTIGAALIYYMVEHYGINLIKDIFENTHFWDNKFDYVVESKIGISIDNLETKIANFFI